MKSTFVSVAIYLIFALTASGTGWELTGSMPAPAPNARGITYGHYAPYYNSVMCDGTPPRVYNLLNVSEYISLSVPAGVWGLSPGVGGIWVSNRVTNYIYVVDTTGSLVSSFRPPINGPTDFADWSPGSNKWVAYPDENRCYCVSPAGSIVGSFAAPGSYVTGFEGTDIASDAIFGDPQTHTVYAPGYGNIAMNNPISIAAGRSAGYPAWGPVVILDGSTNYIYYYAYYGHQGVEPASFGRVKAIFK